MPKAASKPSAKPKSAPTATTVDGYFAALPEHARKTLTAVRKAIKAAAPDAEEVISYQIPTFKYHGLLVSYAAWKDHCSLYPLTAEMMKVLKDDLKGYDTAKTKATLSFSIDKPLPASLVTKIVKIRMAETRRAPRHEG